MSVNAIPVPRSYAQVLGDILDPFLAKTGLSAVKVGSVILGLLETAAQSDFRNSQDVFDLLNAKMIDNATGSALDLHAADEGTVRRPATFASGVVTVGDSRYIKIATKLYQGKPAPIVGSTIIYVTDASQFTGTGSIYLGRGTINYEGPLAYSSAVNSGSYWTITLTSPTTKYHNAGESITLAQGGNRIIAAGSTCTTQQSNLTTPSQYKVLDTITLADGEVSIDNVRVIASKSGTSGNCIAGAINSWLSTPFTGATVTNLLPYSNALNIEDDDTLRERIKALKQARASGGTVGTSNALKTLVLGVTAADENKSVSSASFLALSGQTASLVVDDGTGYEEQTAIIPSETIVDLASGGEQFFQLQGGNPVVKAFLVTSITSPFALNDGYTLAATIGGILSEHTFNSTDFRNINNASAYEVVASINADSNCLFAARTASAGTKVAIFAKADTNEDIQIAAPTGVDANTVMGFPVARMETLRLYKNDALLSKDGSEAIITSAPQSAWGALSSGETLILSVDGTPAVTYTFTDLDFATYTSYATLSQNNSIESWAAVFNGKVPGVTAEVGAGGLVLTSNAGTVARAGLAITGGTLSSKGVFTSTYGLTSQGAARDYTLNRNTGQLYLEAPLAATDRLTASTSYTRAFIQSGVISPTNLSAAANLWFVVDGRATLVPSTLSNSSVLTVTYSSPYMVLTATTSVFSNVQVGDWIILWDTAVNGGNHGYWRVAKATGTTISVERNFAIAQGSFSLANNGYAFVRTTGTVQNVQIPSGNGYTADSFVDAINASISGAVASTYRTNQIRVATNSSHPTGDIALVSADVQGQLLQFTPASYNASLESHLGSVESGNSEMGTPMFINSLINSVFATNTGTGGVGGSATFTVGGAGWTNHAYIGYTLTDSVGNQFLVLDNTSTVLTLASGTPANGTWTLQVPGTVTLDTTTTNDTGFNLGLMLRMAQNYWTDATHSRVNAQRGFRTSIYGTSVPQINLHHSLPESAMPNDRIAMHHAYAIGPEDFLSLTLDSDDISKSFNVKMYRTIQPGNNTYATLNEVRDNESGSPASLADSFGSAFDWSDFATYMRARTISHPETPTLTAIWRYFRFGREGNSAKMQYAYNQAPSLPTAITVDSPAGLYTDESSDQNVYVRVLLPTGAQRTGYTLRSLSQFGIGWNGLGGENQVAIIAGLAVHTIVMTAATPGVVTATLTLPISMSNASLKNGDVIFLNNTPNPLIPTGPKVLTSASGNTITWNEPNLGGTGTITYTDPANCYINKDAVGGLTFSGASIAVGDLINIGTSTGFGNSADYSYAMLINTVDPNGYWVVAQTPVNLVATENLIVWNKVIDTTSIKFFPIDTVNNTLAGIVAAVNAIPNSPLQGKVLGSGGSITEATYDQFFTTGAGAPYNYIANNYFYYLADGINYISSSSYSGISNQVSFTFKNAPDSNLAGTASDWQNEELRVAPITAADVSSYLSNSATGGLSANAAVELSSNAGKLQITTATIGSAGSVQVQGGTSNAASVSVLGSASTVKTGTSQITIPSNGAVGFTGGEWVSLVNTLPVTKAVFSTGTTGISITGSTKKVTTTGTNVNTQTFLESNKVWSFVKTGKFVAMRWETGINGGYGVSTVGEGDWIVVASPNGTSGVGGIGTSGAFTVSSASWTTNQYIGYYLIDSTGSTFSITSNTATVLTLSSGTPANGTWQISPTPLPMVSPQNLGTFRVVRSSTANGQTTYWFENPNAVNEVTTATVYGYTYDSTMVGDSFVIGSTVLGANNVGTYTVAAIDPADQTSFYVRENINTTSTSTLSAANAAVIRILEGQPTTLYKRIKTIVPNQLSPSNLDVRFDTSAQAKCIGESFGTIMQAEDKLAFPVTLNSGIDAYNYYVGLIAEVNRVVYGDEQDTTTYPGIAAAGANININGPQIKRIQVAFSIRLRSGANPSDIENSIKSAVAQAINKVGTGKSIAISSLIAAAESISGVEAVAVTSPAYSAANDLISVQPLEKPLVLNLDTDILITFVGE